MAFRSYSPQSNPNRSPGQDEDEDEDELLSLPQWLVDPGVRFAAIAWSIATSEAMGCANASRGVKRPDFRSLSYWLRNVVELSPKNLLNRLLVLTIGKNTGRVTTSFTSSTLNNGKSCPGGPTSHHLSFRARNLTPLHSKTSAQDVDAPTGEDNIANSRSISYFGYGTDFLTITRWRRIVQQTY